MQKDTPPANMWSDCYMNGGEMKKEADGAWTLHFSGKYNNCSAEVKRVEMSHWSVKGVSILWLFCGYKSLSVTISEFQPLTFMSNDK